MLVLMQSLNEEGYVERCIGDFHEEGWVDRILVIDGGSTDYTREELKKFSKVEVFVHPWLDHYHAMNAMQRNIGLSYIPQGQWALILDFDERMSEEMKEWLDYFDKVQLPNVDVYCFHRRTFELLRDPEGDEPIFEDDCLWPIVSHEIGQYPDPQLRLIRKDPSKFWINSPHHVLLGVKNQEIIPVDILHFEKNDPKHRHKIERLWARAQAERKRLGLTADVFETRLKPEYAKYADPAEWSDE